MPDDRCRITVIGDRHQADVAVPARAPVGEYVPGLARLCGQQANDALPPAWSLALAGAAPVPLAHSLAQAGILDGQRLYLRDIATGEADEPVIADIAETVSDASQRRGRLTAAGRATAAAALGLVWLAAAALYLLTRHPAHGITPAAALIAAGVLLPATIWILQRSESRVPQALQASIALGAVPCLAAAGALLSPAMGARPGAAFIAACGASLGALIALAAIPRDLTLAVQLLAVITTAATGTLTALHAGPARCAAVIVIVAAILAAHAPRAAAVIAGTSLGNPQPATWNPQAVQDTVTRTLRVLAILAIVPAAALAICLVILARSPNLFALSLAVAAAGALLARAAHATFTVHALPLAAAGLTGLFAALTSVPARLPGATWAAPALVAAAVLIVAAATAAVTASSRRPEHGLLPPGADAGRHSWAEIAGLLCNLATLPLAVGVFGVLHQMMTLGRHM